MSWFLKFLNALYRLWFYMLIGIATIVLFPFLFIFTMKENLYSKFYVVARIWGGIIIYGMGLWPKVKRIQQLSKFKSYMLVANHSSMVDIMMMYCAIRTPFVFVGKKELAKMPLFGFFYKRSSILVDRKNIQSRKTVFKEAQRRFDQGNSVCIFPEGGVPKDPNVLLDRFKDGAFRMAIDHQIPVVPIVFYDNKRHFPYKPKHGNGRPGILRVKVLPPISTEGLDLRKDKTDLREKIHAQIYEELKNPKF